MTTKYSTMHYKTTSRLDHLSENSQNNGYNILMTPFSRFCQADLAQFRVGDIVEAQITIAAVPMRNNKLKMICQLRSLALLDSTFTDVSKSAISIKRKIGYDQEDEEVNETCKRIVNMQMNNK